uniref:Uncharacterized protein n=1 Tax=Pseudomonas phage Nican01 TaxID=3138540 RepID=A0AAU6W0N7_9CAUD
MAMVFDKEKNYAEFGNAFFRGRLKGATGEARFKLTADTINAVNTVNIKGAAVTYNFYQKYVNVQSTQPLSVIVDVWDDGVFIELLVYGQGCQAVFVDGVRRPRYNGKAVNHPCLPHNEILQMAKGQHTVTLTHLGNVASTDGFIFVKYIRPTGSDGRPGFEDH